MESKRNIVQAIARLRILMTGACILSGWLAGGNIDRYIVQVPAWRHVDILSWAQYSRHADLALSGTLLYPFEAIGSFFLLLTASIIITTRKASLHSAALPTYFATLFAALGLLFTAFAAPVMISVRTMANDPMLLYHAFNQFHYWGLLRAIAQVVSFCACVWALGRTFAIKPIGE